MWLEYERMEFLSKFTIQENLIFPKILDFGINNGRAYYIMERIRGVIINRIFLEFSFNYFFLR